MHIIDFVDHGTVPRTLSRAAADGFHEFVWRNASGVFVGVYKVERIVNPTAFPR